MGEKVSTEVELDGETILVTKDEYGYYAEEKEPTEREKFEQYLQNHEQVVKYEGFEDHDLVDEVINVHYKHADSTGYVVYSENTLDFTDFPNCNVLYLERDSTVEGADTFVQVDVTDTE